MAKRPVHRPEPAAPVSSRAAEPWAWLTQVGFFWAMAIVAIRLTTNEAMFDALAILPGQPAAPTLPGPATSLLLDLLCCVPALLVLLRRVVDRTYILRWNISHLLAGGLGIWTLLSTAWAGDRFAAMLAGCHFTAGVVLLWSMGQLVRSWLRLRLVAAACAGLLLVHVVQGYEKRLVEHPETVRQWMDSANPNGRVAYMKREGLREDDFQFQQFDKNVLSGALMGFSQSANTYASVLVLLTVITIGVVIHRKVMRDEAGWAVALGVVIAGVVYPLWYTYGRTAIATLVLAPVLLGLIAVFRHWLGGHARLVYGIGVAGFFLGVAAVVGHGIAHGNLGERSLTFRWYYWTGATRLVAQHPILGVGADNFGDRYPQVRISKATEEVKNPHNFIVKAFAELGCVGGALMVAWMLRLWWELTRPIVPGEGPPGPAGRGAILGVAALAAAAGLGSFVLTTDFNPGQAWILVQLFAAGGGALLFFAGFVVAVLESLQSGRFDARPAPWVLYAMLVGLGLFLAHNLIDFSLSEIGPMFLFMLLAGSLLGVRQHSVAGQRKRDVVAVAGFCSAGAIWVGFAILVWGRTALAESSAAQGDEFYRTSVVGNQASGQRVERAAQAYHQAFTSQPLNGDYAFREARMLRLLRAPELRIRGALDAAVAANPYSAKYRLERARYERERPAPEPRAVSQAYQAALELDPHNVPARIEYAEALERLGDREGARQQYQEALHEDDRLDAKEPKRMPQARRQAIQRKAEELGRP